MKRPFIDPFGLYRFNPVGILPAPLDAGSDPNAGEYVALPLVGALPGSKRAFRLYQRKSTQALVYQESRAVCHAVWLDDTGLSAEAMKWLNGVDRLEFCCRDKFDFLYHETAAVNLQPPPHTHNKVFRNIAFEHMPSTVTSLRCTDMISRESCAQLLEGKLAVDPETPPIAFVKELYLWTQGWMTLA